MIEWFIQCDIFFVTKPNENGDNDDDILLIMK